ncbi:N-acetylglucosamine repressor [bacterium HR40]|nr:N-acetylglucosamine repressor [bacterium HR40]
MPSETVTFVGSQSRDQRGTNATRVRAWNERLVLGTIRRLGPLPKAELARLTGLSAQTVSVIVRALEADGLLVRQARLRGRVGQPSVPFALAPDGAFALGFKIGRRSADLVLLDFVGNVRATRRFAYAFPRWPVLRDFAVEGLLALAAELPEPWQPRIVGLGVAMPYEMWNWPQETGAPAAELAHWREVDVAADLSARLPWPIQLCNDATAACGAELVFGGSGRFRDSVYFHIGAFIGGGVVLGGSLYLGTRNNAGALGSMPVPLATGGARQLIQRASLYLLERACRDAGLDPSRIWLSPEHWDEELSLVDSWMEEAADALAYAIAAACAVIDFEAAIIDGALPPGLRRRLVERVRDRFARIDRQGLSAVAIEEGRIGAFARAIGGATLPLLANFALDREILMAESRS